MPKILLSSCLLLLLQAQLCHWVCIHIFENISGLIVQSFFQHVPMIVPHLCANEIHASCCKDRVWVFSLLSVSAVLAAIHLQIAIIFLGWSLLKMTCPFARTYLTQSTMTPRHGSLICADKSMLSVIIIPIVRCRAHPGCTSVLPCSPPNHCSNRWSLWHDCVCMVAAHNSTKYLSQKLSTDISFRDYVRGYPLHRHEFTIIVSLISHLLSAATCQNMFQESSSQIQMIILIS
jgi:hypothetical protein